MLYLDHTNKNMYITEYFLIKVTLNNKFLDFIIKYEKFLDFIIKYK